MQTRPRSASEGVATDVVVGDEAEHAVVGQFQLGILEGPDAGRVWKSTADRAVIGTDGHADVVLTDRAVSRFHCEIVVASGRATIRDLGSRNGTIVDGVTIVEARLDPGATVTVGRSRFRFDVVASSVRIALSRRDRFGVMVGRSTAMRAAFAVLERAAASDVTVLLEGETGTGKELAAESIHAESARRGGPFVVVDCGAVPGELLESELFGHERGAFTGATERRQGAFELASGGTIFLDEIGELGASLQPKLLRALDKREVKRVGGARHEPVDVRVIAATNRSLRSEVNAQRFRSDLYYRLAVVEVRLPALRDRTEDLPPLVEHLLAAMGAAERPEAAMVRTREFFDELARHAWPGNVRELRNYIERCLALRDTKPPVAAPGTGGLAIDPSVSLAAAREAWTRAFERGYLEAALAQSGGNVAAAARTAGVDRAYFYRLLWRHGLR